MFYEKRLCKSFEALSGSLKMQRIIELHITSAQAGKKVKTLLERELGMSAGLITALKNRQGAILINGQPRSVTAPVSEGELLRLSVADEGDSGVLPVFGDTDVIFEDEDILVVNKPPRLPCHPVSGNQRESLSNYLVFHYQALGESFTPRIITRLDSGTSGLVLLAKNALSGSILSQSAAKGGIEKEYLAAVVGSPAPPAGKISASLGRCGDSPIKWQVCSGGKAAVTGYELLASEKNLSLLRVRPETGRTHQIRVHLASMGCPLAGDFLYGEENPALIPRPALHMERLRLLHPLTKAPLSFCAPVPGDMRGLFPEYFEIH